MRRAIVAACLLAGALCSAQPRDIRPASPEGKRLTMEEVILHRELYATYGLSAAMRGPLQEAMQAGIVFQEPPLPFQAVLKDGSLWYRDASGREHPVALSDDPAISYGTTVSRNEFGIDGGCFWSPDGKKLAFYRKDESQVTEFPLLDITTRTGSLKSIRYPMAGMASERISLGIFNTADSTTVWVQADDFGQDRYLTNVSWGPDGKYLFIQVLDRSQKHCRLNMYRAADGAFVRTLLTEDSDKYVEPLDPLYPVGGHYLFLYRSANRDGYRNLYLCDTTGTVRRLTCVDADVKFVKAAGNAVYYTSAEVSPVENHLFRILLTPGKGRKVSQAAAVKAGKPVRLTPERGWHTPYLSQDGKWLLDLYTAFNDPGAATLRTTDGKTVRWRVEGKDPLAAYATGEVEFGTLPSADGAYQNAYRLYKPVDFDPAKKYPVVVYVYGGPHSQMVNDSWLGNIRMWEMYMAQRGYVVYVQDNRGTENHGLAYEQAIHRRCGQAEMADQMKGIEYLRSLPFVDADRIGVHGWSYGGFMTISLLTHHPEVFKVAVAGGPVIDWKWYEVMYGERYMETPQDNPEGYAETSLIPRAKDVRGKLLICQGAIDNTVVWEHSLSFVQACIDAQVQVDYFPYPVAEHNVFGRNRIHLMDKVTAYFDDWL
ncbi:MAG: S9 family peptidase [Bacteroidales bacterium]|nr:S9 family peptidase [Bacteroidales bacterium]